MFWKFKLIYRKIYSNELVYLCSYKHQPTDMQIRQCFECYKACPWMLYNEEMFAGYADHDASFPDAEPDATLNTGYADTDADLCIRIMILCCTSMELF